jgi:hypothetical protein
MLKRRFPMSPANKRVTVYLKPEYHRALRIKAAETEFSVSDLVNSAVKQSLLEDAIDLEAFEKRSQEPLLVFEDLVKTLKRDGKI